MRTDRLTLPAPRDHGFTLLETTVCVGIMMLMMGTVFVTHVGDPAAKTRARALFLRTCDLARAAAAANAQGRSGTLLVVRPALGGSTLTILRGRPIREYDAPAADTTIAPITLPATLSRASSGAKSFTLAFAPDGHLDVLDYAVQSGAPPIDGRPGCGTNDTAVESLRLASERGVATLGLRCDTGEASPTGGPARTTQDR